MKLLLRIALAVQLLTPPAMIRASQLYPDAPAVYKVQNSETSNAVANAFTHIENSPSFPCISLRNTVARILCSAPEGGAADWDLNAVLWAIAGAHNAPEQQVFDQAQERWRNSLDRRCSLLPDTTTFSEWQYNCVLTAFHQRADSLRAALPQDAAAETRLTPDQRAAIQQNLINQGFLAPPADGQFGASTRDAIRKLQQASRENPSGFLTADQLMHLSTTAPAAKQDAARARGTSGPSPTPPAPTPQMPSPPTPNPSPTPAMTESEILTLNQQVSRFWRFDQSSAASAPFVIRIRVDLLRDGYLAERPQIIGNYTSPLGRAAVISALKAIIEAQPFTRLPPDDYDAWKAAILEFHVGSPLPSNPVALNMAPSNSEPFVLRDIWKAGQPKLFGTVSSADEMCKVLKHPFFDHEPFWYESVDWDPLNLGSQWYIDRDKALLPHYGVMEVSAQTQRLVDDNLRTCLRTLAADRSSTLQNIAQVLQLPDAQNDGRSCYLGSDTTTVKYMSPDGQIQDRQASRPRPSCMQWPALQDVQLPRPLEMMLLLALQEGHPALTSLLDLANAKASEAK